MTLDQYQLCPCGSNKKVKFCCARDVLPEINKVLTALQGEQRVAALDHVNHAIEKKGDKDCLLNIKTNILLQLGEDEQARETAKQVLKKNPDNPIALANHALLDAMAGELDNAVDKLQQCLDLIGDRIPYSVIEAIKLIGVALLRAGRLTAGRSHLLLFNAINPEPDQQIQQLLTQTFLSPSVPILMKIEHQIVEPPDGQPWTDKVKQANELGSRGRWLSAIEILQELDEVYPDQPVIRKNLAIYQNCLGTHEDMAEAWSDYAHTPGIDFEDAIEAEAFAQLIDPDLEADQLDVVSTTWQVDEIDKLLEDLLADRRCDSVPVEQLEIPEGQPLPKASYLVFDRERPESGASLTRDTVPSVCGQVYLYGKQTDRPARVSLVTTRNETYDDKLDAVQKVLGDHRGEELESKVVANVSRLSDTMTWDWQFPTDTPRELQTRLLNEKRREIMLERWPRLPLPSLGGKTPEEVVGQDKYRIALSAAVLLLELTTDHQIASSVDLDDLRKKLEIPLRKVYSADEIDDLNHFPIVRYSQIDYSTLDEEKLLTLFQRAGVTATYSALKGICREILNREFENEKIDKSSIYLMLARLEPDLETAVDMIQKARNIMIARKESPARTLTAELEARLERGDVSRVGDLIREIEAKYIREPGLGNELMRILVRFGLIDPRGNLSEAMVESSEPVPGGAESNYVWAPDGTASEPTQGGGIVTGDTPAEQPPQEKKLWIPGMD